VDRFGWSPLHYASSWGRRDTALILLVEGNADVNSCETTSEDEGGTPPIVVAAKGSQVQLVGLLLDFGADINCPEMVHGHTALSAAAELGLTEVVQLLVDYHADINYKSVLNGMTALMLAACNGQHGCITLLLNYFADINILDNKSWNALMHATKNGHRDVLLSAMVHTTAAAKVNLLPWVEMECPHMVRDSLCGSPSVFLDRFLYSTHGVYHGLLALSGDCDVYLVYCLMMLASACKRAMASHPQDKATLQIKLSELEQMLCGCISSRNMSLDTVFTDSFLIGHKPCTCLGPYDIKYLASSFHFGPLALCLDAELTAMIGMPQMRDRIDRCFWSCLKDSNLSVVVDEEGSGTTTMFNRFRYCPAWMFIFEGLSKALILIVVIWHSSVAVGSDVFDDSSTASSSSIPSSSSTPSSSSSSAALVIVLFLSYLLYEVGLMEEKRWMVSPSVVFKIKDLERHRQQVAARHFISDVWRFTDLMALLFMLSWLVMRTNSDPAVSEQLLVLSVIPLSIGLLRYPSAFYTEFGQQVLAIFLITTSLSSFLFIYAATGLGFGVVFYSIFRFASSSSSTSLSSFSSPLLTFTTLVDFALSNASIIDMFEDSGSRKSLGTAVLVLFSVWSVIILSNAVIGYICADYSRLYSEACRLHALIKARHLQQFCLSLEKSPLCMLPPPLNLITSCTYPHHAYYIWRAKMHSKRMFCVSFSGTVSDRLLSLMLLVPMSCYEYSVMVMDWDIGIGNKVLLMLAMPVGCLYCMGIFLKKICLEPSVRLIVKSRLSDGRLRVSYSTLRDSIVSDSLSNFQDENLFKFLEVFRDRAQNEADIYRALLPTIYGGNDDGYNDDDATVATVDPRTLLTPDLQYTRTVDNKMDEDDQPTAAAAAGTTKGVAVPLIIDRNRRTTSNNDEEDDSVSKLTYTSSSQVQLKGSSQGKRKSRADIWKTMKKVGIGSLSWNRTSPYKGKKVRITPGSPFLHLNRVHGVEEVYDALPSSSGSKRLPNKYEQSLLKLPLSVMHGKARHHAERVGSLMNMGSDEMMMDRAPILFLDNGSISPYQAGFTDIQQLEHFTMSEHVDYDLDGDDGDAVVRNDSVGRGRTRTGRSSRSIAHSPDDGEQPLGVVSRGGRATATSTPPAVTNMSSKNKVMFVDRSRSKGMGMEQVHSDLDDDGAEQPDDNTFVAVNTIAASSDPLVAYKEEQELVALNYESLYFTRHRYLPIYSDQEKRLIFQHVLPELFPSEYLETVAKIEQMYAQSLLDNKVLQTRLQAHSTLLQRILSMQQRRMKSKDDE
jgi:hypothetical protein